MTQDEIIKMAWDSGAYTHRLTMWGFSLEDLERFAKLVAAKAIAELESQEPVAWLEPEWGEKICPEVGYEVTMTDDHPRDLCWIPLYPHPSQGEPVAWQLWVGADTPLNSPMGWHFYNTYDSLRSAETSARTINAAQQTPFAKIVPLYTHPPQRTEQEPVKYEHKAYTMPVCPKCRSFFCDHTCKTNLKEKNT